VVVVQKEMDRKRKLMMEVVVVVQWLMKENEE